MASSLAAAIALYCLAQSSGQSAPEIMTPVAPSKSEAVPDEGLWLVNLARHQGHLVGRTDPRSASLHVLALLEGAVTVNPNCADAYYWMYDLLGRLERQEAATNALTRYVRLRPEDDAARLKLIDLQIEGLQTAESRASFIRGMLKDGGLSRVCESDLRRRLASHHFERRETREAEREVEDALRLNPFSQEARELAYEIFGETEPGLQRVELALQLIGTNPTQTNLIWDLAEFLDQISLHRQAQEWYQRAIEIHRASSKTPVPASYWHRVAISYMHSGDFEQARKSADAALAADPSLHVARLLRGNALSRISQEQSAASDLDAVEKAYAAVMGEVREKKQSDRAAEIAWFYCYYRPDKDKSLEFSKIAMEDPQHGSLARLAHGYALRMNGKTDDAIKVLEPLSEVDQMAALELARACLERDDKSRALTVLHKGATIQYSGIAYNMIRDLLAKYGEVPPEAPPHPKIASAVEKFDRRIFDFPKRPESFLKFALRAEQSSLPAGPIEVTLRLENIGPFAITLGDGYLCRPLATLSARIGDERDADFPNYLQVMLNAKSILNPGDSLEKTIAIDVGGLREFLLQSVDRAQTIRITGWFDPVLESGKLVSGPGTIAAPTLEITRAALDLSPRGMGRVLDEAVSGDVPTRCRMADALGAILATVEAAKSRNATPPVVDADAIRATMAKLLADGDWRVRTHAIAASGWSRLDHRLTAAAAEGVRHPHPVVRMLSVRLFADQQGETFRPVAEAMARGDSDRMVRMMARSFIRPIGSSAKSSTDDEQ